MDAVKFKPTKRASWSPKSAPKYCVDTMEQWRRHEAPTGVQADEFLSSIHFPEKLPGDQAALRTEYSFLSTPFDEDGADFLDELGVTRLQITSGDITNIPHSPCEKEKPILLSTGCSTLEEIEQALDVIRMPVIRLWRSALHTLLRQRRKMSIST